MNTSTKVALGLVAVTGIVYLTKEIILKQMIKSTMRSMFACEMRNRTARRTAEQTHQSDAM